MKRAIASLLMAALLLNLFCGCGRTTVQAPSHELTPGQDITGLLKAGEGFVLQEENPSLALYINGNTAEIAVEDRAGGVTWYSNPQGREQDAVAGAHMKNRLASQVELSYFDASDVAGSMTSYGDAVAQDQYTIEKIDGGLRVTYVLGEVKKSYLIPKAVSRERFEKDILNKLDEKQAASLKRRYQLYDVQEMGSENLREEMLAKYPALAEAPLYILNENQAEFVLKQVEELIVASGYTQEDLEQDNKACGIAQTDESIAFTVPVEYLLEGDSLIARVRTEHVAYPKSVKLADITLLPFFGAADSGAQGYMVVPDGSGALIYLNNGKTDLPPYTGRLYGEDLANTADEKKADVQKSLLNLYGMKAGGASFLSVVERGDAAATIHADVAGRLSGYNMIYPSFTITQYTTMSMDARVQDMNLFEEHPFTGDLQLRFYFAQGEQAGYTGMARRYQQYLLGNRLLTENGAKDGPRFFLELLGAVDDTQPVLGIPVKKLVPLTTYRQAEEILSQLWERGVGNVSVRYKAFANNGVRNSPLNGVRLIGSLGGKADFTALVSRTRSMGGEVYGELSAQYIHDDGWFDGYSDVSDSPKNIVGKKAILKTYDTATLLSDGGVKMVSPARFARYVQKGAAGLKEYASGISLGSMSTDLYSDFTKSAPVSRQQAAAMVQEAYGEAKGQGLAVMAQSPNAYVLPKTDIVADAPESASLYYIEDESIPFYQIVLKGVVPFSCEPLNLSGDLRKSALSMIESGAYPCFSFMYAPNDALKELDLSAHSLSYREWMEDVARIWEQAQEVYEKTAGARITAHSRTGDISVTCYDNGVNVYVNHGETDAVAGGAAVKAKSWEVRE